MRIWIVNHYAITPDSTGGTRHYSFARHLISRGHDVTIIAANYNHFSQSFITTSDKAGKIDYTYDVPFIWIPVPAYKGNTIARFWNMLVFSRRLLQKRYLPRSPLPDVIIGSSPHLFAAFGAELLSRRLKKPFLLEIRDVWPDTLVELGRFTYKHPLIKMMRWVERYLYKRAKHIISLLPLADRYFITCGVPATKISWIPNNIDIETIPSFTQEKSDSKFTIMYAGAHGLANNLQTVLDAAKILQNKGMSDGIRICLLGDGPEKISLQKFAETENIQIVEFIDPVPKTQVYAILNQADVFLMLLKNSPVFRWGISPNKLYDYLIMGRPVIFGVDTPFNPIEKANAGISIPPSNPESLAMAIYNFSKLPKDELLAMGQRGKEYAMSHHHITPLTDKMEKLLTDVVGL